MSMLRPRRIRTMVNKTTILVEENDRTRIRKVVAYYHHGDSEAKEVRVEATYESGSLLSVLNNVLEGIEEVKNHA